MAYSWLTYLRFIFTFSLGLHLFFHSFLASILVLLFCAAWLHITTCSKICQKVVPPQTLLNFTKCQGLLALFYSYLYHIISHYLILPSIAQLLERRTVVGHSAAILRSLVRLRLEGIFFAILVWISKFKYSWLVISLMCQICDQLRIKINISNISFIRPNKTENNGIWLTYLKFLKL